ncbi:Spg4p SCDLUD_004005 [Saccharomycodes ludwigii]|uniref:Spg4p n=1 Tax=Saccharomycodes ludwigii TaxID=36035 RepID=UPI001E855356|nr:hypothetical protein SCDLUD_004005 [Saccharomycodes ludwigii]KAH3899719.1 hypothetical protein SCDLUD_004005 [Saccharomycodes ludwigii]
MTGFFDSFRIYSPKKHASSSGFGGNSSNSGSLSGGTMYLYSKEYVPPSTDNKLEQKNQDETIMGSLDTNNSNPNKDTIIGDRRNSISSTASSIEGDTGMKTNSPYMVDIRKITPVEFEKLYNSVNKKDGNM